MNNKRQRLSAIFNELVLMKYITSNPVSGTRKFIEEVTPQNRAFSDKELKAIKKYLIKNDPYLYKFCQLIYYGLLRPNEARQLQIKHLELDQNRIMIPADVTKRRKRQYIGVSGKLKEMLLEYTSGFPGNLFVFGPDEKPGPRPCGVNFFSERFRTCRKALDLPSECKLYSWKHTGAVRFYQKTKDIKALQLQCRHYSIEVTDTYLKSFGFLDNKQVIENFPDL